MTALIGQSMDGRLYHMVPACRPGIYIDDARYMGLRDGDTLIWNFPTVGETPLRLDGVDCPEIGERLSKKAASFSDECCRDGRHDIQVYVKFPEDKNDDGRLSLKEWLQAKSWDRVIGTVFIGSRDLRAMLVERGLAHWV